MASITNNWIGYLDRSYQQIKANLLAKVTTSNPELTDHSESNIFVIIISMFAGIAEMLGYYIDNIARESFMATALRRSSVINHTVLLDYRVKARNPETADIILTWLNSAQVPTVTPSAFTLGAGSSVQDAAGNTFITLVDNTIAAGSSFDVVSFAEALEVVNSTIGTTNGTDNQQISIGIDYLESSLDITINGQSYSIVDTFANSGSLDFHYLVNILEDGIAYVKFGDGVKGALPPTSQNILATYFTTQGIGGKVAAGTLTEGVTLIGLPANTDATSTNNNNSSGGTDYEDIEAIRKNAIQSIRTMNRMVTRIDHQNLIEGIAGINRALVDYCCGKEVNIYISPTGGGVASTGLIASTQAVADLRKMVTSFILIKSAGETEILIGTTVTAKIRKSISETKTQVDNALVEFGAENNQYINGTIRLSDVISLIDGLTNVESVVLTAFYTKPYARPANNVNVLNWTNETKSTSDSIVIWTVLYTGTIFQVFKNNLYLTDLPINTLYIDPAGKFEFTIEAGSYTSGDKWDFKVYRYLQDLILDDYTIPVIRPEDLFTTVIPLSSTDQLC